MDNDIFEVTITIISNHVKIYNYIFVCVCVCMCVCISQFSVSVFELYFFIRILTFLHNIYHKNMYIIVFFINRTSVHSVHYKAIVHKSTQRCV